MNRKSIRKYKAEDPKADAERILEAGRYAPSADNEQPWDFFLVTDRWKISR